MNFDLESFLKNHKPESLAAHLNAYLNHPKLEGYSLLEHYNMKNIVPTKTYIKYIPISDAYKNKKYGEHIKSGGILLKSGKWINRQFMDSNNPNEWKYFMLKFEPFSINEDEFGNIIKTRQESRIFFINIKQNYIFFKTFKNSLRDFMIQNYIDIELRDINNNIVN